MSAAADKVDLIPFEGGAADMTERSAGQGQPSGDEPTSYPDETVVSPWSAPAPQGGPIPQPPIPQDTPYPGAQAPAAQSPYPGAQPPYPAAQPQYPAAQPQYPGAQPQHPGAQPHSAPTPYPAPPYPGAPQAGPGGPRVVPQNIQTAFYVMLTGAVVTVLSALYSLTTISEVRAQLLAESDGTLRESELDMIAYGAVGGGIIGSLITVGLWVWMAFANRAGKNWARITGTVFFGINVLFYVFALLSIGFGVEQSIVQLLFSTVVIGIGIAALVLLWSRKSASYFAPPPPISYLPYPGYPPNA